MDVLVNVATMDFEETLAATAPHSPIGTTTTPMETATVIYLYLTKEIIKVQRMDVEAKKANAEAKMRDAEAKIRAEDAMIMLADLGNMDDDTRAWFVKKRDEILVLDASCAAALSTNMPLFGLYFIFWPCLGTF
jgi:hypothetical protein